MRERLALAAPAQAGEVTVGTFHAFCLQLLREYGRRSPGCPRRLLLDRPTRGGACWNAHLAELGLEHYFTLANPASGCTTFSARSAGPKTNWSGRSATPSWPQAARDAADPDDEKAQKQAAQMGRGRPRLRRLRAAAGASKARSTSAGCCCAAVAPAARAPRRARPAASDATRQILVDEYQDMNRASSVLLQLLAGDGRGLWVVGDLRQAIYRFRGASPANITQFEQRFPRRAAAAPGRQLPLRRRQLVGLFRAVGGAMALPGAATARLAAAPAAPQPGPRIWHGRRPTTARPKPRASPPRSAGATPRGGPTASRSILCRTHRQAAPIARALEAPGMPVLYLGPLFERARSARSAGPVCAGRRGRRPRPAARWAPCRPRRGPRRPHPARSPMPAQRERFLPRRPAPGRGRRARRGDRRRLRAPWPRYRRRRTATVMPPALPGPLPVRPRPPRARAAGRPGSAQRGGSGSWRSANCWPWRALPGAGRAPRAGHGWPARRPRGPLRAFLAHVRRLVAAKEGTGRTAARR